mgnify:CR=1 FL=1
MYLPYGADAHEILNGVALPVFDTTLADTNVTNTKTTSIAFAEVDLYMVDQYDWIEGLLGDALAGCTTGRTSKGEITVMELLSRSPLQKRREIKIFSASSAKKGSQLFELGSVTKV